MKAFPLPSTSSAFPKVSIIGAGKVGSTLAQRIAEKNFANVILLDIVPGLPQAIALDLMQARGIEQHSRLIIGTNDYGDTAESDVVVITAGLPRKPGMSRDDLLHTNAKIVYEAAKGAIAHSPNAIFIIITNPLDVMTYLAWKTTNLPPHRIMGMAGVLDSARLQTFIALEVGVSPDTIQTMVLGGHGDSMVPIPRYCTVSGVPISELLNEDTINQLVERTRHGGAEVVKLMKTGGAYFAPASSACLMVESILLRSSRLLPTSAYLQGEYGLEDIFMGVPCHLGREGIEKIVSLSLTEAEMSALHASAQDIRDSTEKALKQLPGV